MKILLVRNDRLGNLICTTPVIEALRRHYPTAQIDIVVNSSSQIVLEGNPFIDKVYTYTRSKYKKGLKEKIEALKEKTKVLAEIFKTGYDVAVMFRNFFSSSAYQFITASRAKRRIGPGSKRHFTDPIPNDKLPHEVEWCYKLVEPLGVEQRDERCYFPLDKAKLREFEKAGKKGGILLNLSTSLPENQIDVELGKKIVSRLTLLGVPIYLHGTPFQRERLEAMKQCSGGEIVETSNLKELASLLSLQKCYISVDGNALHLGSPVGVPTVAIFGKNDPARWAPYRYRQLAIKSPTGWAKDISPDEVIEKVKKALNGNF
jgi:ADP-heptose:LPS heptosyltransferase